ncbi:MAG: DNRLRE domain-containing protein [Opitutaceae bacterium]|jgi:hypothetical protein
MNTLRQILQTAFVTTLMSAAASAATLTLNPTADTFVRADSTTSTAGAAAAELLVGQLTSTQAMHGLLSFDLSSIPVDATINSVSLVMRQSTEDGSSLITTVTLELHLLTQTFVENQATWNNRVTGTAWTTAGGTFDSAVLSSVSVSVRPSQASLTLPLDQTWASSSDFVSAVQSAADGSNSIAFLLKDANETNAGRELVKFYSKEGSSAPQLIIDYTAASIPEPSTVALLMGSVVLAGGVCLRRRSR